MQWQGTRGRFDWLVELCGASALAVAAAYSALKWAPGFGMQPASAMTGAGLFGFGIGLLVMRSVRAGPAFHRFGEFSVHPIEADELLLTEAVEDVLLLDTVDEDAALLLEDRLPEAEPDSRVVQLFASSSTPTPGELKARIDRHLATGKMHVVREFEGPAPDASDALFAALRELKRSLH